MEYQLLYRDNPFTPYFLPFTLGALLTKAGSALFAVKCLLSLIAVATRLAMARWLKTIGANPMFGLFGLMLAFDRGLQLALHAARVVISGVMSNWQPDMRSSRFLQDVGRRFGGRRCATGWRKILRITYHVERTPFHLFVDPADVFAEDSRHDELRRCSECHHNHGRRPTWNRLARSGCVERPA